MGKPKHIDKPKTCKCGITVLASNFRRHVNRCSASAQPVQDLEHVSDVLHACGLSNEHLGGWKIEELDKLPNLRSTKPTPRRQHTSWTIVENEGMPVMPSLERVLVELQGQTRTDMDLFQENETVDFDHEQWGDWAANIIQRKPVQQRVLNMPVGSMMPEDTIARYKDWSTNKAAQYTHPKNPGFRVNIATINITPRGARTNVHHDSHHHMSTVIGFDAQKGKPMKLWLLWPSTEVRHLVKCQSDTNAALVSMDFGCFLVQMEGECVFVPPNSPHAVMSLESCYLYGHVFTTNTWAYDPSAVAADVEAGMNDREARWKRIEQLRLGLHSDDFRQAYIDQFIETWATDRSHFYGDELVKLVELWADDIESTGSCGWCIATGALKECKKGGSNLQHAREHLGLGRAAVPKPRKKRKRA